jgi:hypothetical protein
MSNFKNYILKAQGEKTNINISGFINENFSKYIAKFAGYVLNEDINYFISDSGKIHIEYDTGDNKKATEIIDKSTISDLYDHLVTQNNIKDEGFKLNGKEIKNLDDFKNKIKDSKKIPENEDINSLIILKNKNNPFFHITSSPINSAVKQSFINFFIAKRVLGMDKIILEHKDNFNEIILNAFKKENKFFFHRKKFDEPIVIGDIIADKAIENLATSAVLDKNVLEKIKIIFNDKKENLKKLIEKEKNHLKLRELEVQEESITDFINKYLAKIKNEKGIIEIKFYTEPLVAATGTPKT